MSRPTKRDQLLGVLLTVLLGIFGALALAHWSACEQDDAVCAFTGSPR